MELLKTKDYDVFKKNPSNRTYNEGNIRKIMTSLGLKNKMDLRPVIVDKNMFVMDGQHRIEAARRLGMEVSYVVDEDAKDEDIILLNSNQKSWKLTDYLNYYCQQQNPEYVALAEFMTEHELSITQMRALMSEGDAFNTMRFKTGKFIFPKEDKFHKVNQRLQNLRQVQNFIKNKNPGTKMCYDGSVFINSFLEFISHKEVDFDIFLQKLEYKLEWLRPCTNMIGYKSIFKNIYNWKNKSPVEDI